MTILGVDLGTSTCVLSTIERGALTVITNEISERYNPAIVTYTDKERVVGELAKTQMRSHWKTTCRYMKQIIGLTAADNAEVEYEQQYSFVPLKYGTKDEGELAGYEIESNHGRQLITGTLCLSSLLVKLKEIAETYSKQPVTDVVVSVPAWYSDRARQNVVDAASIAGLNCLRTLNEHSAVALDFGIYRSNNFTETTRVAFVDVGHASSTVTVADFTKNGVKIVAVASDKKLGGRDVDLALTRHFANLFKDMHEIDCFTKPKALLRLEDIAARVKKVLTVNPDIAINDIVYEDYELKLLLTRNDFNDICEPLYTRFIGLLDILFNPESSAGMSSVDSIYSNGVQVALESISSIEVIGGGSRLLWIQNLLSDYFKKPLSRTLNTEETVAKGCALQAAIYDPRFRVRKFELTDVLLDPVTVSYYSQTTSVPELKTSVLFSKNNPLGVRKFLTFNRYQDFDIQLTPGIRGTPLITRIEVPSEGIQNELPKKIKLGAKLTTNGVVNWDDAQLLVEETVEELVTEKRLRSEVSMEEKEGGHPNSQTTTTPQPGQDGNLGDMGDSTKKEAGAGSASSKAESEDYVEVKVPKTKTKTHTYKCNIITQPRSGYLETNIIEMYKLREQQQIEKNLAYRRMLTTKNDLEAYIYNMQNLFNNELAKFTLEDERASVQEQLSQSISWLYELPADSESEEVYVSKFDDLKNICEPINARLCEYNNFQKNSLSMSTFLADLQNTLNSNQYAHVDSEKLNSLQAKLDETSKWFYHVCQNFRLQALHEIKGSTADLIEDEHKSLVNFSGKVLIPKPSEPQQPSVATNETTSSDPAPFDQASQTNNNNNYQQNSQDHQQAPFDPSYTMHTEPKDKFSVPDQPMN